MINVKITVPKMYVTDPGSVVYQKVICTRDAQAPVECWPTGRTKKKFFNGDVVEVDIEVKTADGNLYIVPLPLLECIVVTELK